VPRRPPLDSPFELRKRLLGERVTDYNAGLHGVVVEARVHAGTCYVTVNFDGHRRVELEVIGDKDERPLTPLFIRVSRHVPREWFSWRKPDDLVEWDEDPSGDVDVTVTVRTPERARPERREEAAWYFAEVLAGTIDDVLDQELWPEKPADEQSGQIQTRAEVERINPLETTSPLTIFAVGVKVLMFVDAETALDLLAKLYLLLDCKHARYPDLWQDVFVFRGVRDASPSSFFVTGRVGGRDITPTTIPLHYFTPPFPTPPYPTLPDS
jgi:hypothetical protein